jgi:hypothetical protein
MRYKSFLFFLSALLPVMSTATRAFANTPDQASKVQVRKCSVPRTLREKPCPAHQHKLPKSVAAAPIASKNWCIVVQDMTTPNREEIDNDVSLHCWSQGDEYRTHWKTHVSDGSKFSSLPGLIDVVEKRPFFLKVKTLTCNRWLRRPFLGERRCVSYQVDQLIMQPLTAKTGVVVAGQAELAEARESVRAAYKNPWPEVLDMPYQYLLNPLSFEGNHISFEMRSNAPGGAHPQHSADWRTIAIKKGHVRPVKASSLRPSLLQAAKKEWSKLELTDDYKYSYDEEFDNFILLPFNKGVEVEWAFPNSTGFGRGSLCVLDVKPPVPEAMEDCNSSLAPDGSALVSWKSGNLFWQSPPSAKPRLLGHVENPRGWEWLKLQTLSAREKKLMGL